MTVEPYYAKKYEVPLPDGTTVETAYVDRGTKQIVCYSTQVGCPFRCRHCRVGALPFVRNLTAAEMLRQCAFVLDWERFGARDHDINRPILFSATGTGEPLANMDAVVDAVYRMAQWGRTSLSTMVPNTLALPRLWAKDPPLDKLQISLHGATDEVRARVVGHTHMGVGAVVQAGLRFEDRSGIPVEWNYVVIRGVNDSPRDVMYLTRVLPFDAHIKLNGLNPVDGLDLQPGDAHLFETRLLNEGYQHVERYQTDGVAHGAACGQLGYSAAP